MESKNEKPPTAADPPRKRRRLLTATALIVSGAVQAVISPPASLVWLHPFAWIPAFAVFDRLEWKGRFLAGWLVGFTANVTIFYWLVHTLGAFTNLPWAAGVGALVIFAAVFGAYAGFYAILHRPLRAISGPLWPLAAATAFCACEFCNPQLFPYYQGVAWYRHEDVFLLTSYTGVPGISFMVMAANATLLEGLRAVRSQEAGVRRRARRGAITGMIALAAMIGVAVVASRGQRRLVDAAAETARRVRVAIIQSNHGHDKHRTLRARGGVAAVAADLVRQTEEVLRTSGPVDVVVWPETALPLDPEHPVNHAVVDLVRRRGIEIWTGAYHVTTGPDGIRRVYNSGFRIHGRGEVAPRYDKVIRVPFGEFMPFEGLLPALRKIEGSQRIEPGAGPVRFETPRGSFCFLICYEAIQPTYVRRAVELDPDLLVNITYDGWFGDTSEPSQHLMLSAIQSAQFGVPMLRAAATGVSAVVDAGGRIVDRLELDVPGALVSDVPLVKRRTFYARHGDVFGWSVVILTALLSAGAPLGRRARRSE